MARLRSILARIAAMFRRRELDERIDDELRFHIEMQTEENIRRGMSPSEARRQARIECGGVEQVKELHRDVRGWPFVETILQDLRFAYRSFRRDPGFTSTVLVTLALGIGVSTAIFSIVNAVLFKPLPYLDPDRVVMLWYSDESTGNTLDSWRSMGYPSMSAADFLDRKRSSRVFENMAAFQTWGMSFTHENGEEDLRGFSVTNGFFEVLGVRPVMGRPFLPEEYKAGNDGVLILLYDAWHARFGADPQILGRQLQFGERRYRIVGVMPPGFVFFQRGVEFLMAGEFTPSQLKRAREYPTFRAVARLKEGVSLEQAQAETDVLTRQLIEQYYAHPDADHRQYTVMPVTEDATRDLSSTLSILFAAVMVVALIVCSNVANLLLGRASFRAREMAVRAAIGAGRRRLIRQLLTESLLLSLIGGAAGFGLAHLIVQHFQSVVPDQSTWGRRLVQAGWIQIDGTTAVFAAGIAIAAGLVFGIAPALRGSRSDLNGSLKDSSAGSVGGRSGMVTRKALIVVETALATVLVCCAGLLIRSFVAMYEEGPGFKADRRITMRVGLRNTLSDELMRELRQTSEEAFLRSMWLGNYIRAEQIRERLLALPGVRDVAFNMANGHDVMQPFYDYRPFGVYRDGNPSDEPCPAVIRFVSRNYFDFMGIPILGGRGFDSSDRLDSPPVMVVSRQAARTCWHGADPIGSEVRWFSDAKVRVVGLTSDVRDNGIDKDPTPVVYRPYAQEAGRFLALMVHTDGDPADLAPSIREVVREVDSGPNPTRFGVPKTLQNLVRDSAWRLNYSTMMLGGLAGLSLLLAAVGVYGVLSQAVRQRTREIGLRMALGAEKSQVQRMMLRQGLAPVCVGLAIGILAAAGVTRFLGSLLYGVEPLDAPTFAGVALVLLASALLASYIPARRAASVDPMAALRHE